MKASYESPALEIVVLENEQCIMSGSNTPGLEPGTDLDDILG